jgi:hypothetical protein
MTARNCYRTSLSGHRAWLSGLRASLVFAGLAALLGASACHKKETPAAETKTEAKPATAASEARKPQRGNADEGVEVPTEEDFEEATEQQITATSDLQKELDQLEKQIQQP